MVCAFFIYLTHLWCLTERKNSACAEIGKGKRMYLMYLKRRACALGQKVNCQKMKSVNYIQKIKNQINRINPFLFLLTTDISDLTDVNHERKRAYPFNL